MGSSSHGLLTPPKKNLSRKGPEISEERSRSVIRIRIKKVGTRVPWWSGLGTVERAAFHSDDPSPSLRRDLPRAVLSMLTSVPEARPDAATEQSHIRCAQAGHGRERESGGLGELNWRDFEWEGRPQEDDDDGEIGLFVSSARFLSLSSLSSLVACFSLSLKSRLPMWGFVCFSFYSPSLSIYNLCHSYLRFISTSSIVYLLN